MAPLALGTLLGVGARIVTAATIGANIGGALFLYAGPIPALLLAGLVVRGVIAVCRAHERLPTVAADRYATGTFRRPGAAARARSAGTRRSRCDHGHRDEHIEHQRCQPDPERRQRPGLGAAGRGGRTGEIALVAP